MVLKVNIKKWWLQVFKERLNIAEEVHKLLSDNGYM
jgi:hypothetical protein